VIGSGYTGVENYLFFRGNKTMLFAGAKKMTEEIVKAMSGAAHRARALRDSSPRTVILSEASRCNASARAVEGSR
jgi:hypothetical protein